MGAHVVFPVLDAGDAALDDLVIFPVDLECDEMALVQQAGCRSRPRRSGTSMWGSATLSPQQSGNIVPTLSILRETRQSGAKDARMEPKVTGSTNG